MTHFASLLLLGMTSCAASALFSDEADPAKSEPIGFFFEGSALYLKSYTEGLPVVVSGTAVPSGGSLVRSNLSIDSVDMDSRFGFRVQGGYTIPQVDWTVSAEWLRYNGNGSLFKAAPRFDPLLPPPDYTDFLMMPWTGGAILEVNETAGRQRIYLNLYDFLLEKKIPATKHFTVLLGAGGRLAHLNQYLHTSYTGSDSTFPVRENFAFKNLFSGAGVVLKSTLEYTLFYGFGLDADVAFSLLAGKFRLKLTRTTEFPTGVAQPNTEFQLTHEKSLKSSIELAGGAFWREEFMNGKWGLKVFANYRFSYWPSQTRLQDILPSDFGRATLRHGEGDVSFLGWEFGANLFF